MLAFVDATSLPCHSQPSFTLLPPYRIIEQICILRQTLTINFSQENIKYLT
jgi:hypothetical protein